MTLNKTIEILNDLITDTRVVLNLDDKDAIELGIEALKFWKRLRNAAGDGFTYLLPGEDPE